MSYGICLKALDVELAKAFGVLGQRFCGSGLHDEHLGDDRRRGGKWCISN